MLLLKKRGQVLVGQSGRTAGKTSLVSIFSDQTIYGNLPFQKEYNPFHTTRKFAIFQKDQKALSYELLKATYIGGTSRRLHHQPQKNSAACLMSFPTLLVQQNQSPPTALHDLSSETVIVLSTWDPGPNTKSKTVIGICY